MLLHLYTWLRLAIHVLSLYLWYGKATPFYTKALQKLRDTNILFTKIFQSLANTKSLELDPHLRPHLQKYTTNTSYTENEINYETLHQIEREYGVQIDRNVINSGMIALVFKGTDSSGNPIIVKLKRNNIVAILRNGCASVLAFYKIVSYFYPRNIYVRILRPFIENIDDIIEQCDFNKEIANLRQAKADFADLEFVQIPTVYNKGSTEIEYILMECIDGTHLLPPTTTEQQRINYMEQFCIFHIYALLSNAIQHTDLHSGNIMFTKTGIAIIDYGMAIQADDNMHEVILSICEIIRDDPPLHEIDFIDTFQYVFDPPLSRATIPPELVRKVEDNIISIVYPMLSQIDIDELNVTDNVLQLSACLKRDLVINMVVYKILLGFSMMSAGAVILGTNYPRDIGMQIERNALTKAYERLIS